MNNWWPSDSKLRVVLVIMVALVLTSIIAYFISPEHLFDYLLAAQPEVQNLIVEFISVGPFNFQIEGQQYVIKEAFSVSGIEQTKWLYVLVIAVVWAGMMGFLTIASFWKRYWFLFISGLFLLFIHQLSLDAIGLFGASSGKWASGLLMALVLLPAYYFHAFREKTPLFIRWLTLFLTSGLLLFYFQSQNEGFYLYFMSRGIFGASTLAFFFMLLVAEEIIFFTLMLVTGSKGGKNNEKHLIIFSVLYLTYLILYWADKMGLISGDWDYLNPYYLLIISTLVSVITIVHKQPLIKNLSFVEVDIRWLFLTLGITTFGTLTLGYISGNDAISDGLSYLVVYTHIGFGVIFLLYLIVNFITPLVQGLMVYKIAYSDQNFPYITARLGGIVFVVALFLYGEQLPVRRIQAAHYNMLGDYHKADRSPLAQEYYEEAAIYGWDNHYASMQLGKMAADKGDINESIYRYTRATTRNPSPQSFISAGLVLEQSGETTRAISVLKKGLLLFPAHPEITNNLSLLLDKAGASIQARELLSEAEETESWNHAVEVNRLALGDTSLLAELRDPSVQVRPNFQALINQGLSSAELEFELSDMQAPMSIYQLAYLINSGWGNRAVVSDSLFQSILRDVKHPQLGNNLLHSQAFHLMKNDFPVKGINHWNQLISSVGALEKGRYFYQLGVLYLSMHAPRLAYDAFEESDFYKYDDAQMGLAVASMESQDWTSSKEHWREVIKTDSTYSSVLQFLGTLNTINEESSFAALYYGLPDDWMTYEKSIPFLSDDEVNVLWRKAFDRWSEKGDTRLIENYFQLAEPRLSNRSKLDFLLYQSSGSNIDSLTVEAAKENPFEEWRVLAVANSVDIPIENKYQTLIQAITNNPYRPELIKSYARVAIELGLYDYAEQATLRLLTLISPQAYQRFERELFDLRQKRENLLDQWGS